jgi:hypothetical protein
MKTIVGIKIPQMETIVCMYPNVTTVGTHSNVTIVCMYPNVTTVSMSLLDNGILLCSSKQFEGIILYPWISKSRVRWIEYRGHIIIDDTTGGLVTFHGIQRIDWNWVDTNRYPLVLGLYHVMCV